MKTMTSAPVSSTPIAVAFISDDGYVMPTCVAITSLIQSKKEDTVYHIHIVCASLTGESENIFKRFESERVHIHIIRQSAERFAGVHVFQEGAACVATPAALLKFVLPELITEYEKVLYLDGDLLVREDLAELYQTELGEAYLAAVVDSGTLYGHNKFFNQVQDYFNSGVMLMNLAQMRRDSLPDALIRAKMELKDSNLMDQNIFNHVCDKKVVTLPVRYNFLPINLLRAAKKWTLDQLNRRYGTQYPDEASLFADAAIIHFSSKDKPWKDDSVAFADDWYRYYFRAPIEHTLSRSHQAAPDAPDVPKVSVIVPVGSTEAGLRRTLDSLLNQTLGEMEILCVSDGSGDGTLEEYAAKDSRIRIYPQTQAETRNTGLDLAAGTYVCFAHCGEQLDADALERCWETADANSLDVLLFDGDGLRKKKYYPSVYSGQDIYAQLSHNREFSDDPCLKLYRRAYLQDNRIRFPETHCLKEVVFAFSSVVSAERVKAICFAPCHSPVRPETSTAAQEDAYQKYAQYHTTACLMLEYLTKHALTGEAAYAAAARVNQLLTTANAFFLQLKEAQRETAKSDPAVRPLEYTLLSPVLRLNEATFFQPESEELRQYRKDCESLLEEKRIRWEELQGLYKEKGERWKELQALKKEKGERWQQMQALKKEMQALQSRLRTGVHPDGTVVLRIPPRAAQILKKITAGLKKLLRKPRKG